MSPGKAKKLVRSRIEFLERKMEKYGPELLRGSAIKKEMDALDFALECMEKLYPSQNKVEQCSTQSSLSLS